jgi:hypothetical protein
MCLTLKVYLLEKIHIFECQGITVSYNRESWSFPLPLHRTTQCMSSLTDFQQTICHSLVSLICYNMFPLENHLLLSNVEGKSKNEMTNKMLQNRIRSLG